MEPTFLLNLLFFAGALVVLVISADKFVSATEEIGLVLGIPHFIMGITVLAVGTSFPELITAFYAVQDGSSEIVIGTVIGSNIANILFILGFTAVMSRSFNITWDLLHGDLPMLFGSLLMLGFVVYPLSMEDLANYTLVTHRMIDDPALSGHRSYITVWEGILLLVGYGLYLQYYAVRHKEEIATDPAEIEPRDKFRIMTFVWLILGIGGVLVGAKYTVDYAVLLAVDLGLGNEVVAASMIAMGTSMPELVVSISAVRRNNFEMVLGNITGSNIFNTFVVLGLPAVISPWLGAGGPIKVGEESVLVLQFPYYAATLLLFLVVVMDKTLTRTEGWVIMLAYVLFIAKLFSFV